MEHKLSDVVEMVREELDVAALTGIYRGTCGETLLVPLHKMQRNKLAIPVFRLPTHHIVVMEADSSDNMSW